MLMFEWFKRLEGYMTLKIIQGLFNCKLLKIWGWLQMFEMVVKYCGMTIKLMEDQGTLTEILFVIFFMKICERGRSMRSLFHT